MTSMLVDCHPDAPARPPDWRWRLAEAIHSGQLPPSRGCLDAWLGRALRSLSDQAAGKGDAPCPGSALLDPAVLGAFLVRAPGNSRQRSELEARVLAGQTFGAISSLCGLTESVVEAYERLFFDVRARLGAADYVMAMVIGIAPHGGLADVDALLKVYAYGYGPLVLDAVIAVLDGGEHPERGADSAVSSGEKLIRMAIAARMIPVNAKTAPGLIRLQARLLEFERGASADVVFNVPIRATIAPWPTPAIGEGAGQPVRASVIDLGSATLAEPIHEVPIDPAGAITVVFPEPDRGDPEAPIRRTA